VSSVVKGFWLWLYYVVIKVGCGLWLFLCPQIRVAQERVIHAVGKVRRTDRHQTAWYEKYKDNQ